MNAHYLGGEKAEQDREREMLDQEIRVLEEELMSLLNEIKELQEEIERKVHTTKMFNALLSRHHGMLEMTKQVVLLGLESLKRARANIHQVNPYILYGLIAFWKMMKNYIIGLLSFIRPELRLFI